MRVDKIMTRNKKKKQWHKIIKSMKCVKDLIEAGEMANDFMEEDDVQAWNTGVVWMRPVAGALVPVVRWNEGKGWACKL